ncbi:MAG: nodulation protein NfeD, partial [Planctomycetota bacterium]
MKRAARLPRPPSHRAPRRHLLAALLIVPALAALSISEEDEAREALEKDAVVFYPVEGKISGSLSERLRRDVEQLVEKHGARIVIFELNTPGGTYEASRDAAAFIFDLDRRGVETFAYVPNGVSAYSGGTLLAFACRYLVMGDNSGIGDVAGVNVFGKELSEKYQTVVRKDLVRYAKERGYPVALVESMVSKELQIFEIREPMPQGGRRRYVSGQELDSYDPDRRARLDPKLVVKRNFILTIDEMDARRYGFVEHIATTRQQLLEDYGLTGRSVDAAVVLGQRREAHVGGWFVDFLNHPFTKFVLIVGGILGFVIELQIAGFGIAGTLGLLSFALFFLGGALGGTVGWLEIGAFTLALGLLAAEVFVIPGFGVAGVAGLALLFTSLVLALQPVGEPFETAHLAENILVVLCGLGSTVIAAMVLLHYLPRLSREGET